MRHMMAAVAEEAKPTNVTVEPATGSVDSTVDSTGTACSTDVGADDKRPHRWPSLTGAWRGQNDETYFVSFDGPACDAQCSRHDPDGSVTDVMLRYDGPSRSIWLGARWTYYAEVAELLASPSTLEWHE